MHLWRVLFIFLQCSRGSMHLWRVLFIFLLGFVRRTAGRLRLVCFRNSMQLRCTLLAVIIGHYVSMSLVFSVTLFPLIVKSSGVGHLRLLCFRNSMQLRCTLLAVIIRHYVSVPLVLVFTLFLLLMKSSGVDHLVSRQPFDLGPWRFRNSMQL